MKRASTVLMVIALAITALLIVKLRCLHARRASVGQSMCITGQKAPNFALRSLDGKTVHLSDFHDKAVLVHFWSTSWLPCRVEMQWFEQMHRQYGPQGLQVLGIEMGDTENTEITEYANNLGVDYPILLGSQHVGDSYGVRELPLTVYVGRDGTIIEKVPGVKEHDEIEAEVKKALSHKW
jgi:peroxiredoxin